MDFQQIKYFCVVAETQNFTRSAELTYTSQPTISRQISLLEHELGYNLFDRHSKPLRLTPPGKILYDGMKKAISLIDYTVKSAKIASEGKVGSLSIAFQTGYYAEYMLFPIINEFKKSWPAIQIRYNKMSTSELLLGLNNTSIDIAIGLKFPCWFEAGYHVEELQQVETLIVMSSRHRLAGKTSLDYDDLQGETFYLTAPNGYQIHMLFKDLFSMENVKQVEVSSSEIAYFKAFSENGLTISNPYDPYLSNNPYFHSISLTAKYSDQYACAVNPQNMNPVINLFWDLLLKYNETVKK